MSMTKPKRRRRKGTGLPSAAAVLDFRPGLDVVVREDGRTYVRDSQGLYADFEVVHDALNDEVRSNLDRLDAEQAAVMFESIRTTPFLSPEGRKERLDYLLARGKVQLRFDASTPSGRIEGMTRLGASRPCQAGRDGECNWDACPQLRDGEPQATGRHCPLDTFIDDES